MPVDRDAMITVEERRLKEGRRAMALLHDAGFKAMFAGGCVRDRLMNREPKDFDIATSAAPQAAMELFRKARYKVIPTGIEHGTITVVDRSGPIEITTLRRDVKTDGRHAEVEFGASFEEDAARRDFTINAMFEDIAGNVHDFFGGRDHLRDRKLAFVGDPVSRIREDYLRILRFFRFWARFDFEPDVMALEAIALEKQGLQRISQERVTGEILQTLAYDTALKPSTLMLQTGVLHEILPEAAPARVVALPMIEALRGYEERSMALMRLGAFLWNPVEGKFSVTPEEATALGLRLRLPTRDTQRLTFMVSGLSEVVKVGTEVADALAFIDEAEKAGGRGAFPSVFEPLWHLVLKNPLHGEQLARIKRYCASHNHIRIASLPVGGRDLMQAYGIKAGPELGQILDELKREFRNGVWSTREAGLKRAALLLEKIQR